MAAVYVFAFFEVQPFSIILNPIYILNDYSLVKWCMRGEIYDVSKKIIDWLRFGSISPNRNNVTH